MKGSNDDLVREVRSLRADVAALRSLLIERTSPPERGPHFEADSRFLDVVARAHGEVAFLASELAARALEDSHLRFNLQSCGLKKIDATTLSRRLSAIARRHGGALRVQLIPRVGDGALWQVRGV